MPQRPLVLIWSASGAPFASHPELGFSEALNRLIFQADRTDVVLCRDTHAEAVDRIELLSTAAATGDQLAGAGPLWVSDAGEPAEAGDRPAPLYPRICSVTPDCCLLRRPALDLLGQFRDAPTPAGVLSDWCARATGTGMGFVQADDLVLTSARMPAQDPLIDELGPLRRSLARARRRGRPTTVTIDARALGPQSGGTQAYTAALILAVAEHTDFRVRAVSAHDIPADLVEAFGDAGVDTLPYEQAVAGAAPSDVVHRPQQVFGAGDLNLARLLSDRLVLTHLDLIAFHNPRYHASTQAWMEHRRMTRIGMTAADQVVFTSAHARADALAEELIESERASIAGIGVSPIPVDAPRHRPRGVTVEQPFLLVLGTDYAHKNRLFALRLFKALRDNHGFQGRLVLAGRHMDLGGTAQAERDLLDAQPDLATAVSDLGSVSEAERNWLLEHTVALLCPSLYEGYGLTPLEAAAAGTPCLYAAVSAHADVLGETAATIVPWDPDASAQAALALLSPGEARDAHLSDLDAVLARCSWMAVAGQIASAYERALSGPFRPAAQVAWSHEDQEYEIHVLRERRQTLEAWVGHGLTLAGSGGLLTEEQQVGLMRVASRRRLNQLLLAPFEILGRLDRHQP